MIYNFLIITQNGPYEFKINTTERDVIEWIFRLYKCFGLEYTNKYEVTLNGLMRNTKQFRTDLSNCIEPYKNTMPQLNKLENRIKEMANGDFFYFFPTPAVGILKDDLSTLLIITELSLRNQGASPEDIDDVLKRIYDNSKDFFSTYSIDGICNPDKKRYIGEPDKSKRLCRFCLKGSDNTTFKNQAHAISDALGNKFIFLNEECDECNAYFSDTIERDIQDYLRVLTVFFKVKNKSKKVAKVKEKNFEWFVSKSMILAQKSSEETVIDHVILIKPENKEQSDSEELKYTLKKDDDGILEHIDLYFNKPMVEQNIYKCLVKFALSTIESEKLIYFKETINWVRTEDKFYEALPKIALRIGYENFDTQPSMSVWIRKDDNLKLPFAVGEFSYTCLTFVFIVPIFTDEHSIDFTQDDDYKHYWSFFKNYSQYSDWKFYDFSSYDPHPFIFRMNLKKE